MKCNKCGTPIIPGENTCRICGNKADFSKRVKEPEIIDFPDEIEEKVEIKEEVNELPDLTEIIDIEDVSEETNKAEENEPQMVEASTEQPLDLEQTMSLEPSVSEESQNEVKETVNEVVKTPKSSKKKVLDKVNEKESKPKKVSNTKKETKSSNNVGMILLSIVLICSLVLNIYLFIMDGNAKAQGNGTNSDTPETYSKVSYDNYKITIPSSWITENGSTSLLIYDDTQNWTASMQVVSEVDFDAFVTNKETLVESLGNKRYQFTSNYSKEVNEKDFHLFKGKYYDYSVYVITTELTDTSMLVVDLKFKGEVDDILLNNILNSMTEVKENNTTDLFKDNFEFQDISNEIKSISQKTEE